MITIGLVAAMAQESEGILRYLKQWDLATYGSYHGFQFQLMGRACYVITSGMGISRAANATRTLLETIHPQLLISFGIAGAVHPDLHIGDVVISEHTCLLENDTPGDRHPLATLSTEAWDAAAQVLMPEGARLFWGTAITTHGSQLVLPQGEHIPNPVLEMETMGIYQVTAEKEIPLVSIRSISDGPQAPIPFNLAEMLDKNDSLQVGKMLKLVLRRPQIIFQGMRMLKNSRRAIELAAGAVVAVLSQEGKLLASGAF
jgi:adenosylhomocysteine nucleosidase